MFICMTMITSYYLKGSSFCVRLHSISSASYYCFYQILHCPQSSQKQLEPWTLTQIPGLISCACLVWWQEVIDKMFANINETSNNIDTVTRDIVSTLNDMLQHGSTMQEVWLSAFHNLRKIYGPNSLAMMTSYDSSLSSQLDDFTF